MFHEYAHGLAAYYLGDPTAKNEGRLTLNPLVHMDLFGTVILPLLLLFTSGFFIGYAKPVPYNPENLKDKKYGSLKVALAGPLSNLFIALVLGLFLRFFGQFILTNGVIPPILSTFVAYIVVTNIWLALFNLIPFPPLDGSKVLYDLSPKLGIRIMNLGASGMILALLVAFFLLPGLVSLIFQAIVVF